MKKYLLPIIGIILLILNKKTSLEEEEYNEEKGTLNRVSPTSANPKTLIPLFRDKKKRPKNMVGHVGTQTSVQALQNLTFEDLKSIDTNEIMNEFREGHLRDRSLPIRVKSKLIPNRSHVKQNPLSMGGNVINPVYADSPLIRNSNRDQKPNRSTQDVLDENKKPVRQFFKNKPKYILR